MARAYFGSRLSENIIKTPEGYIVCKNVPIARTGVQEYLGSEFGAPGGERVYKVTRPEKEVFHRAAVASFEGKPVCDEHPSEDVTPENYTRYIKGVCRDVRRGDGSFKNCLLADLIIYDADLIREIENGKREISCGYDCIWNPTGDTSYEQLEIRGNHIAVVDKGRAGSRVAIRDAKQKAKERKSMKKTSILGRMLAAFAKDEETTPEELAQAAKIAGEGQDEEKAPVPVRAPERPAMDEELNERISRMEDAIENLIAQKTQNKEEEPEETALDALEEEIKQTPEASDEEPCVAPEEMAEDEDDVVVPSDEINAAGKETRDAALHLIRRFRPIIAKLPERDRRRVSDSLAILIRGNMANDSQYNQLLQMQRKSRGRDSQVSDADYGRRIRDKYNPHYNN